MTMRYGLVFFWKADFCLLIVSCESSKRSVIEVIRDFTINARKRDIKVEVVGIPTMKQETRYQAITEGVRD